MAEKDADTAGLINDNAGDYVSNTLVGTDPITESEEVLAESMVPSGSFIF